MVEATMNLYEGLFLLSQQAVASDYTGCVDFINEVFEGAEAELIALRKWDERRLAYPIKGQKRGTYMLAYFRARGAQIANIERSCNLSEQVLRSMFLRVDHLGETELELAKREAEDRSVETALHDDGEAAGKDGDAVRSESGTAPMAVRLPAGQLSDNASIAKAEEESGS